MNECCKSAAKEAAKSERRRVSEIVATLPELVQSVAVENILAKLPEEARTPEVEAILATLPESVRLVAAEAIFGPGTPPSSSQKNKWIDLSVTTNERP